MSEKHINKSPLPQHEGRLGVGIIPQGYKQTSIGIIPHDWEVVCLGEVCDFIKTYQNARSDLNDYDEISYIHYGKIHTKYKHFIDFAKAKLPKINAKKLAKETQEITFCQNGDLVVVDASEDYTAIAKSAEIQNLDSIAVAGLHTFLLRDKAKHFISGFKGYILYNSEVYKELKRLATGISVLSVSKANLYNLQIPLPPLKEQEKIARILGVWDSALDTLANLIKAKHKYKTALMQRLLTPPKDIDCETKSQITPSLAEGARGWVNPRNDKFMDCHENPYGFAGFASESRNDNSPPHHTTSPCHTDSPLCHTERSEVSKSKGVDFVDTSAFSKPQYDKVLDSCNASPPSHTASTSCHTEGVARSIQKDNAVCLDTSLSTKAQNDREKLHNFKNKPNESSLRFAGFSDKWQEFRLGDLLKEKNTRNTNNVNLVLSVTNKQGFVAQKDYFEQEVASNDTSNYKVVCRGEFAYNPARINVGSIAILENFENGILSPMYIVFECLEKISKNFFKYWLESYNFKGILGKYLSGSVRETLSFNDMKTMKIFIPTLAEQKKIAQVLSACDKEIETLNLKFECLKAQKRGLMQQLLSGKIRVKI